MKECVGLLYSPKLRQRLTFNAGTWLSNTLVYQTHGRRRIASIFNLSIKCQPTR